ncbi:N,N-dimethylformamidase beta subunit family domain-containing protein [Agromyces humatus]|uniref:Tachylectin 2 domain-containing protein n=1 Tax=Agromyces humatus TaxID=279573 RepID=A0ABN2K9S3_9MICO|nr:N,N-dimethylformamidase beta subunit family domain-containing protein [Agromyces humatus]
MDSGESTNPTQGEHGPLLTRRTVLRAGAAVIAAAPIIGGVGAGLAAAPATALDGVDPKQRFVQMIGGGNGVIYAIAADGKLYWYRHRGWTDSSASWANNGAGRQIGKGWAGFVTVLAGSNGTLFALLPNGDLTWYRYLVGNPETGAGSWAARSGSRIGTGFTNFPRHFGGYDGIIWGVTGTGDLYWYRYLRNDGTTGSGAWAGGTKVGNGWSGVGELVADSAGVIYAMAGSLRWYRYVNGGWAPGSGRVIDSGWAETSQKTGFCAGSGALYRIQLDTGVVPNLDDKLRAYRLITWSTAGTQGAAWHAGKGRQVGTGFTFEATAALQGYATTLDVRQGGVAAVAVSTSFASYRASVVRLAPGTGPQTVRDPVTLAGAIRTLPGDYRSAGCDWPESFSFDVPAEWPSGLYSVRVQAPGGLARDIPFTVRPALPTAPIAVLLPTLTYRAYNHWGGHNQYTVGQPGTRRALSMLTPQRRVPVAAYGRRDHTWYSDQLLLRWMSAQGISYDVYEDEDLHASGDWLLGYQALVLPTHPEYWTETMRTNLIGWLGTGGRLMYLGGNGIYERVTYDTSTSTATFRNADGSRDEYRELGLPESQIFGVAYDPTTWGSFAAYRVVRDHPLFAGTGLSVGSTFGASGYNGPASGWEVDARLGLGGDATSAQVLAEGLHARRSAMVFMERPNGGFVFSAASLTFVGGLDSDPRMSRLLRNVFDRALAPHAQQLEAVPETATPTPTTPIEERGPEGAYP